MKIAAKFEFVSKEQYLKDFEFKEDACEVYSKLKKPHRATAMSAGYDFYSPFDFHLEPGKTIKIPTGIRAKMPEDYVLMIYPRSGLGFKYRLQLNNTVGVIDSDYYNALNEGHIMIKITNDSNEGKALDIKAGEGFAQGIFMQYGIVEDDDAKDIRVGGFGSTTK
ncbi:MAG: deoxyuridine 5'-triphosphate nucleotidohydrolase [Clostridium sp. CAG:307_30_263]|nr:MAG: deoxyuridine 5'-triphosphate nucleotidohydrolase [Clostridium sp. CAG:307_30_263]